MSKLEMAQEPRTVWILLNPAEDVEGQWVAHCLDLDVVTQGSSLEHAAIMAREAVDLVIETDAAAGQNPFDREEAPQEDWQRLYALMHHAVPLRHVPREKWSRLQIVAMPYAVCVPEVDEAPDSDPLQIPDAWLASLLRDSGRDSGGLRDSHA
jgi:predicted RNase H-like HicB family nuclease